LREEQGSSVKPLLCMESSAPEILWLMPGRLLIAAGDSASGASSLPFGIGELIAAADEILVRSLLTSVPDELTAARRARIAAADVAEQQPA
jgi:hypothetical protein